MLYTSGMRPRAARGLEYLQNTPKYVTYNDLGQKVINSANLVNDDGTAHIAYKAAPGTRIFELIDKQKNGHPLTESERREVESYWASNPTAGLATLNQLGGSHNGGITTQEGTPDKNTTSASNFSRVTRRGSGYTTRTGGFVVK